MGATPPLNLSSLSNRKGASPPLKPVKIQMCQVYQIYQAYQIYQVYLSKASTSLYKQLKMKIQEQQRTDSNKREQVSPSRLKIVINTWLKSKSYPYLLIFS